MADYRLVSSKTADETAHTKHRRPRGRRVPFAGIVLAAAFVCGLLSLLPDTLPWWPVKLGAATCFVLLLPGAAVLRVVGWPRSPAAVLSGCAVWSIALLAPGIVVMLVVNGGLDVVLLWLLVIIVVALVAGRGRPVEIDARVTSPILLLVGTAAAFAVLVAFARYNNVGDAIEHIARIRKLTELDPLRTLAEINLLPPDTGLHPGYAFPLWHATIALVVRISGVEEAVAFRTLPVLLVPVVAAAIYRAGRSMFGCRAAGVAAWIAYLVLFAFPYDGVGYFNKLTYPGNLSIFLLWPLVVDRTFAYLRDGGREPVWTLAAASFVVAAIHSSYNPMMMLLIGAFAVARLIVVRRRSEVRRFAVVLAAVSLPFLLLLVWLYPIATSGASSPLALDPSSFETALETRGGLLRLKPSWVTRGGAGHVAALLLAPLAVATTRTRAAAFIASGTAVVILTLIVPWAFTPFSDVMSMSQARRFLFYLPWGFALVGGALVLARFRHLAVGLALLAGCVLQILYPGDFNYRLVDPGPGWVAWFAALAVVVVFAVGAASKLHLGYREAWTIPIIVAFALPIAVAGVPDADVGKRDVTAMPPELVHAVRRNVDREDVLMAPTDLAYRLTARAPVYVVAVSRAHSADTLVNRHGERRSDVDAFFNANISSAQAEQILRRWDVQWLLINKHQPHPQEVVGALKPVFDGPRYALYRTEVAAPQP